MDIRKALLAMGYREIGSRRWLKPVGFQLFMYSESTNYLENWFKAEGNGGAVRRNHSVVERDVDPLIQIKEFEAYSPQDHENSDSHFEIQP